MNVMNLFALSTEGNFVLVLELNSLKSRRRLVDLILTKYI